MKNLFFLFIFFTSTANASVVIDDFELTTSSLSFHVKGTVTSLSPQFRYQLLFGLVDDDTSDWFDYVFDTAVVWEEGPRHSYSTLDVYSLSRSPYSDSILTRNKGLWNWYIGAHIDIKFDIPGKFNPENFDINNFGMQVGSSGGTIVDSTYNIVDQINPVSTIPIPPSIFLFGSATVGLSFRRKYKFS